MRLLDRYLLRELLVPLAFCLAGFFVFWISFDLFSEIDDFQENGISVFEIAQYYAAKAPELLVTVMPIALLLALLYALTNHARHNELAAMRAAGVSLWRITLPYIAVGIVFSGLLFALNELWAPNSAETAYLLRRGGKEKASAGQRWQHQLNFRNARDGRIWNIEAFNVDTWELRNPQIEWARPDGFNERLIARSGLWTNRVWTFFDVQTIVYSPNVRKDPNVTYHTNAVEMPQFAETPEQIQSEIRVNSISSVAAAKRAQLSVEEIRNYLRLHPDLQGAMLALLKTQLHARLAAPWTCLVVVLIAIPFGAPSGRRNVFFGVAGSIFIAFAFFVLMRFGLALGTGGYMPAWLAAWLPNLLFGLTGIVLTMRVR